MPSSIFHPRQIFLGGNVATLVAGMEASIDPRPVRDARSLASCAIQVILDGGYHGIGPVWEADASVNIFWLFYRSPYCEGMEGGEAVLSLV